MRRLIIIGLLFTTPAFAQDTDKFTACEKKYKAEQRAAKEAAPKGYVPAPVRGKRAAFMVECLSNNS